MCSSYTPRGGCDSNGAKNNELHPDGCSPGGRSGRKRLRLNPVSTSKRYLPYGLMCSYRAGESRAMSSSFTVRPSARSCSITAAMYTVFQVTTALVTRFRHPA